MSSFDFIFLKFKDILFFLNIVISVSVYGVAFVVVCCLKKYLYERFEKERSKAIFTSILARLKNGNRTGLKWGLFRNKN